MTGTRKKKKGKKGRGRERASEVFVLEVRERAQRCGECRLTERCAVQNVISIHLPRILQRTKGEKNTPRRSVERGGGCGGRQDEGGEIVTHRHKWNRSLGSGEKSGTRSASAVLAGQGLLVTSAALTVNGGTTSDEDRTVSLKTGVQGRTDEEL